VVPSYNEMANLQKGVLDKIAHFLSKQKFTYEVIVVDDGSDDGSVEFVENFVKENPHFRLIKNNHMGKAGAVSSGMLSAKGEWRLFTDMDQATPIEEVNKLLEYANKGYDVVIGSRSNARKGAPWTRLIMANGMIVLRKILVGLYELGDTQCGFKMFSKSATEKLFTKAGEIHHGFSKISGSSVTAGFDIELLYLAKKYGFKIKEVPVTWLYVETRRVSPIKDSFEGLFDLLRIKLNSISGKYKV
jgi:dolichyl-phosphate beta-glucosyltransferase